MSDFDLETTVMLDGEEIAVTVELIGGDPPQGGRDHGLPEDCYEPVPEALELKVRSEDGHCVVNALSTDQLVELQREMSDHIRNCR